MPVFTMASPQDLGEVGGEAHEVVDELRVLEGVEQHHLGVAQEHRDGPRAYRHRARRRRWLRLHERLALLEEAGEPPRLVGIRHDELGEMRLVLQHVALDGRHDIVGVLHPAAEGFRLLGEVVVREHHVRLEALVVVHHRRDRLDGIGAVLLDAEAVEGARERRHDRIHRHAVGERALVGGDHPVAVGQRGLALLRVPELVDLHVARRQLGLVLHELGDRVADAAVVGAAQALEDLLHAGPRDRERHLVILGLAEDPVARAREDHLRLARLHRGDDDVGAHRAALERRGEAPASLPQGGPG
jgi:hypothetical protein